MKGILFCNKIKVQKPACRLPYLWVTWHCQQQQSRLRRTLSLV